MTILTGCFRGIGYRNTTLMSGSRSSLWRWASCYRNELIIKGGVLSSFLSDEHTSILRVALFQNDMATRHLPDVPFQLQTSQTESCKIYGSFIYKFFSLWCFIIEAENGISTLKTHSLILLI